MELNKHLDFYRFDGEGGGALSGSDGPGEASVQVQSDQEQRKQIVYGRSEDMDGTNRVGTGTGGQVEDLEAEFAQMVGKGGRFHDIYGQKVSETVQNRFRNQQNLQAEIDAMTEGLAPLYANYGIDAGDFEGLRDAIAHDDAFYQAGAEKAGLTVDQYKQHLRLQADSDRLQQITESYQREQEMQERYQQAEIEADELREAFPNFDLGLELESNEEFSNLLRSGVDVKRAFLASHADEIFAGNNFYAQKTAKQDAARAIQQRQARPMESALQYSPAIERRSDPSKLTNEDMDEIDRIVMNGGTVAF